jgi:hypothetical protein
MMDFNFRFGDAIRANLERPLVLSYPDNIYDTLTKKINEDWSASVAVDTHITDDPTVGEDGIMISQEVRDRFASKPFDPTGPSKEEVLKILRED